MNKEEALQEIAEIVRLHEEAIMKHPAETSRQYTGGRDAFMSGLKIEDNLLDSYSLTADDWRLLERYMLASSFISSWWQRNGNNEKRDNAAHSCCHLISSLGPDSKDTFKLFLHREQLWNSHFSRISGSKSSCLGGAISAVGIACILFWMFFIL